MCAEITSSPWGACFYWGSHNRANRLLLDFALDMPFENPE